MPLSAGTRLGPYEILAPLGAGGMGEVYRARDPRLNREVAIKVLPERLSKDPQALARFESEAKAVAALSHPNILAIHDFGNDQGVCYAVTELLEGETLRSRLGRSALPWRKVAEIGVAIADGLATAHSKGIIHRDLKPEKQAFNASGGVPRLVGALGHANAISGQRRMAEESLVRLKEQSKQRYVAPYDIAVVYIGLEDKDQALKYLEMAYTDHSHWMIWLREDPRFDPIRGEPRYQDLLRRMHLTP